MRRMRRHAVILAAAAVALLALAAAAGSSRPLTVGLVLETSAVSDPFQHGAFVGLQRAVRELGVKGKAVVPSPRQTSYLAGFAYLARQKYGLIVGLGFLEAADLDTAALKFPGSKFAIVDASLNGLKHRPRNVLGTHFKTEEAGYLAGYLAALMEMRRPGKDVIGSVGGYKIPTVDAYIAGYQAGARKADPGITVLNGYSNDFLKQAKCKAVAQQQITAGAGVIFQVADICGLGALAAAEEKHVWGIGVDIDQSTLGPHILTSVVKRLDVAVYDTVKSFRDGRLRTGTDAIFDLANNGVGLGKISPKVPREFLDRLERVRKDIVAGRIMVPGRIGAK
jgi:basic membrane protein A and related proteins